MSSHIKAQKAKAKAAEALEKLAAVQKENRELWEANKLARERVKELETELARMVLAYTEVICP